MNALIVGYGRMGKLHAKVLRDLGHTVTTVDPDPSAGAEFTSDVAYPVDRSQVDDYQIVCVATPIPTLAHEAQKWIGHDGWLLIEKPMASTAWEAAQLAHELHGQRVAVGYVERFNPVVRAMKRSTNWDRDKPVTFTRWNTRTSPNPTLDLATHDADLSRYLGVSTPSFDVRSGYGINKPVRQITAATRTGSETFDLTRHDKSPLHHMWQRFLEPNVLRRPEWHARVATPEDAVRALELVEAQQHGSCGCDSHTCLSGA